MKIYLPLFFLSFFFINQAQKYNIQEISAKPFEEIDSMEMQHIMMYQMYFTSREFFNHNQSESEIMGKSDELFSVDLESLKNTPILENSKLRYHLFYKKNENNEKEYLYNEEYRPNLRVNNSLKIPLSSHDFYKVLIYKEGKELNSQKFGEIKSGKALLKDIENNTVFYTKEDTFHLKLKAAVRIDTLHLSRNDIGKSFTLGNEPIKLLRFDEQGFVQIEVNSSGKEITNGYYILTIDENQNIIRKIKSKDGFEDTVKNSNEEKLKWALIYGGFSMAGPTEYIRILEESEDFESFYESITQWSKNNKDNEKKKTTLLIHKSYPFNNVIVAKIKYEIIDSVTTTISEIDESDISEIQTYELSVLP